MLTVMTSLIKMNGLKIIIVFNTSQRNTNYEAYIHFIKGLASSSIIRSLFSHFANTRIVNWIIGKTVSLPIGYQGLFPRFSPIVTNNLSSYKDHVEKLAGQ